MTDEEIIKKMLENANDPELAQIAADQLASLEPPETLKSIQAWVDLTGEAKEARQSLHQFNLLLAKIPAFNEALRKLHAWRKKLPESEVPPSKPKMTYEERLAQVVNPEHLRFIEDMKKIGAKINLLYVSAHGNVIPAVQLDERPEADVRAATSVKLIVHDDCIYPEWNL